MCFVLHSDCPWLAIIGECFVEFLMKWSCSLVYYQEVLIQLHIVQIFGLPDSIIFLRENKLGYKNLPYFPVLERKRQQHIPNKNHKPNEYDKAIKEFVSQEVASSNLIKCTLPILL